MSTISLYQNVYKTKSYILSIFGLDYTYMYIYIYILYNKCYRKHPCMHTCMSTYSEVKTSETTFTFFSFKTWNNLNVWESKHKRNNHLVCYCCLIMFEMYILETIFGNSVSSIPISSFLLFLFHTPTARAAQPVIWPDQRFDILHHSLGLNPQLWILAKSIAQCTSVDSLTCLMTGSTFRSG